MIVKNLIRLLQDCDPNADIIVHIDEQDQLFEISGISEGGDGEILLGTDPVDEEEYYEEYENTVTNGVTGTLSEEGMKIIREIMKK